MALTFPRALPYEQIATADFDLQRAVNINTRRGGAVQVSERAEPRWIAEIEFGPMERADYQKVRAWWRSLQGGLNDFYLHDPAHPRPINYRTGFGGVTRHGGGSFDGMANVDALSPTSITISNLPSTFALEAGDYVGLVQGDARGLHTIVEAATAASGVVTVTVEPKVKTTVFTTAATVNFEKPVARFMGVPNSQSFEFGVGPRPFSFKAIQRII